MPLWSIGIVVAAWLATVFVILGAVPVARA